ncbi:phage tail protein [uncultured Novosphingobium sp.]|uniref:phage tail protein n=1 Tax=uncultured Novosphingobium sp. TaxID=292277 RepID=UPI00258F15A7|nr:phage tail protein [uncultured Novosphingobium sp.]
MSKTLRTVATIAGAIALVATGVGAIAGGAVAAAAGSATAATAISISTYAGLAAGVAGIGAQLTAKKPSAKGSVSNVLIQTDAPQPYLIGRTFSGGVMRHDVGYGGKVGKVKNPYRGSVVTYSGAGPVEALESAQTDFAPVSAWYSGFLYTNAQLGAVPEAAALVPHWAGMPNWTPAHKLSGQAAILWNFKFDKDGKRFSSGLPPLGAIWKGVKVYDPRLDSTYPGGMGPQRIADEATWTWSENPALHAIAYALGRRQNGRKVFGIGLPATGIDLARMVAWANVCDANGWKVGGVISEPGDRWANLKDIMAAGGAEPVFAGGVLTVRYRAPMVALETVTENDLTEDDISVTAMQSYRDRLNGIVPKFRSEAHNWEYVSAETVTVPAYVAEDGEEKVQERQINLVQDGDQAAQLAAYELVDGRELGPIVITLKPQWRRYKPGECLHLTLPSFDLDTDAIILSRDFDPGTMKVKLTLVGETPAKHAFALGQVAVAPPTPALGDAQDRDETIGGFYDTTRGGLRVVSLDPAYPVSSDDERITIVATSAVIDDGRTLALPGDTIDGLTEATNYALFWNLDVSAYEVEAYPATTRMASSSYAFIGWQATLNADGTPPESDAPPPGWGGGGYTPQNSSL